MMAEANRLLIQNVLAQAESPEEREQLVGVMVEELRALGYTVEKAPDARPG